MAKQRGWSAWVLLHVFWPAVREVWPELEDSWKATAFLPGSDLKIAVMQERVERGLPVHHPKDRTLSLQEGYLPGSVGGELKAVALLRECSGGQLKMLETKTVKKRQRSEAEMSRRKSSEMKARERQRGQRRRQRRREEKKAIAPGEIANVLSDPEASSSHLAATVVDGLAD